MDLIALHESINGNGFCFLFFFDFFLFDFGIDEDDCVPFISSLLKYFVNSFLAFLLWS